MTKLGDLVEDPGRRRAIVEDCCAVIEAEVGDKRGIGGALVKTTYRVVKALRPGMIASSVDGLLDDLAAAIEPFFERYRSEGRPGSLRGFLLERREAVAESLLQITDRRAERAGPQSAKVKAYRKLRPKGKEHVIAAMPRVAAMLERHAADL